MLPGTARRDAARVIPSGLFAAFVPAVLNFSKGPGELLEGGFLKLETVLRE